MRKDFARSFVTKHNNVAILTLNHPETLNATSLEMVGGLSDALRYIENPDNMFRAAILTGAGRGFSSGANLAGGTLNERGVGHALETAFHPFLRQLNSLTIPIIAAVNGPAVGIGMSIALTCDLVVASKSAYFFQSFARIGLIPDGGSTWLLPRLIGLARAKELSLLAEKLPAETAFAWGLINRLCSDDNLMSEALTLAEALAKGPTKSLSLIRRLFIESMDNSYEDQLDLEQRMQVEAALTEDFVEGVAAFLEKRPATFKGK